MEYTLHVEENLIVYNLFVEETIINYSLLVEDDGDTFLIEIGEETCGCFQDCPFGVLSVQGPSVDNTDPRNPKIVETDPVFQAWLASNPGFVEVDPIFSAWLALNPLNEFLTEELDPVFLSWLFSFPNISWFNNDAGYITEQRVEEYPSLASFPLIGEEEVVYIAANTGLFYSWNGVGYVPSSAPTSGISGGGMINRLPKFTPNGTTIGSSNYSDDGLGGRYNIPGSSSYLAFYAGGNTYLRLQRASNNKIEFIIGNSGAGQPAEIVANNALGFEFNALGAAAYLSLKANNVEGLKVLPTGKLIATQNPDAGSALDSLIVRDSLGNLKQIDNLLVQTKKMFNTFRAGTTSLVVIGNNLGINLSAVVTRTLTSTSDYNKKQRIGNVTAASAGSVAHYRLTTLHFILDGLEYFEQTFGTAEGSSTSGMRAVFGISTNIGAWSGNIEYNTLTDFIGIGRLSTSDNWHIIHNDNVGLATTVDLGSNFPANISEEIYTYRIIPKGVNDLDIIVTRQSTGLSVTHNITSNIPSTSVSYTVKGSANNNTNAVAFGWDFFAITEIFK